jgi:hypothetical protein
MAAYGGYDVIYEQEFLKRKFDFSNIEFNEYPMLINSKARAAAFARAKYFHWLKSEYSENNRSEFLDPQKNVITKNLQKKTSYEWQNEPDKELPELYSLMIDKYKLIAPETTEQQFTAVFTGQPIESINPIKWHQDNASELLYFIYKLEQSNNIVYNPKRADYQKMTACFVKPDGSPFTANWRQLKTQIKFRAEDRCKAIDELVSNF